MIKMLGSTIALGFLLQGLAISRLAEAQVLSPFLSPYFAPSVSDRVVPAREPWTSLDHGVAVKSAVEAAALLPDRSRTIMQVRLAAILMQNGETAAAALLLRQTVEHLYRPGAPLRELAQRLVEVDAVPAARDLAASTVNLNERQVVLAGMIDGAIKVGEFDVASDALRAARRLPSASAFDPFAFQAKAIVVALAKAGHYRQALAAFPTSNAAFLNAELSNVAKQACAADPALVESAASVLAEAALGQAASEWAEGLPLDEIQAYASCKGDEAARRLIAEMPADIAEKVLVTQPAKTSVADANQLAADALKASRDADPARADLLVAAATAKLDAGLAARGRSREAREGFDNATNRVALSMLEAKRPDAAVGLVGKLPPLERLPIFFKLTRTAVRMAVDPALFLTAIDADFLAEPALINIEAEEIRALRGDLPLDSPAYAKIQLWLDKLPPAVAPKPVRRKLPIKGAEQIKSILAALEVAAPSTGVIKRALDETAHGNVAQAIIDAKTLTLTSREAGTIKLIRDFIAGFPDDILSPITAFQPEGFEVKQGIATTLVDTLLLGIERAALDILSPIIVFQPEGLEVEQGVAATPVDSLLFAIERAALDANNKVGAREAFTNLAPASPLKAYGRTTLAVGVARLGRPREALDLLNDVTDPSARFWILRTVVLVTPLP